MIEIKSSNERAIIMDLVKTQFGSLAAWKRMEPNVAMMCADLPEASTVKKKKKFIKGLERIKKYLVEEGINLEDLSFLDEEIERYEKTKQISLYEEQDDEIEPEIIKKYARLSYGTEGVMGIHLDYNYEQLKRLVNGVYNYTGLIKFYVSREKTIYGKVIAEIYEHPQKIPIATLVESKKIDKETGEPLHKRIALFGEKINLRDYSKIKEIEVPFRVYRFISEHNQDLILLTPENITIGDYIITGVITQVDDFKSVTDSCKLPTKLPYMFAQTIKNRIIKFKNHDEFRNKLRELNITKTTLFDFPFTIKKKKLNYVLKHPEWFKWLMWAWITHSRLGLFNRYPMHILMAGDPHSGKSMLLNALHARSQETRDVFSGSSSTLKNLVPSFKYNPARLGYLAESNRFSFCDEFLRCLVNTKTTHEGSHREEGVAIMNDLLEHQKREAGSGVSRVNVNMTARVIATTNPIKEVHCVADLVRALDHSFLSRWLIYYQTKDHVRLIQDCKENELEILDFDISNNDWISIIDYLHTFTCNFDEDKIETIFRGVEQMLSSDLLKHYHARHKHHLTCLLEGIVKTRCLFEKDMAFNARAKDYEMVEWVWLKVIGSWIDSDMIKHLPMKYRVQYLPENSQYLFNKICEEKRRLLRVETEELALKEMSKKDYKTAYIILRDNGLLIEDEMEVMPYYMGDAYETKE